MYTDEFNRNFSKRIILQPVTIYVTRTVVYPGSSQDITKMSPVAAEASELCFPAIRKIRFLQPNIVPLASAGSGNSQCTRIFLYGIKTIIGKIFLII
jgi:hypothetical protein